MISRADREEAMKAVIADVLLSGDFNPVSVNVEKVRRPIAFSDEEYWADTGVVVVTMVGLMPPEDEWTREEVSVNAEDMDDTLWVGDDDKIIPADADDGIVGITQIQNMGFTIPAAVPMGYCSLGYGVDHPHERGMFCENWKAAPVEERDGERAGP